jgi:hypothetical protein
MTALNAGAVPLAVRVKNNRYDGLLTGYLHGAPKFTKTDPGGMRAASFTVDQRQGFRSDMIQPYSRIYIYNTRNGNTVFEGDISHPGRSITQDGPLFEVQVEGPVERLNDWSGPRIYVDRDMQAWVKNPATSNTSTTVETGDDRGGSGLDALTLSFQTEVHVETNYRCEAIYSRIAEAGQTIGRFDYTDDGGHTSGDPGWQVRTLLSTPSTVARTQTLNVSGHTSAPQNVTGNDWDHMFVQLIWTGGSSSTGSSGNDIVWVSIRGLVVVARTKLKDGTNKTTGYSNAVTADQVWEDMLGSSLLSNAFDGPNASIDLGTGAFIYQLAYPDGVTPMQIADDLMTYEPGCTYLVGPSNPLTGKYTIEWISRPNSVRYEAMVWTDEYQGGTQAVDQYNEVAARWKTPVGNIRMTVATQTIPEMDAAGRKRRYFQDLGTVLGDASNVTTANNTVLQDHRYPKNGGRLKIARPIVDLFTGRRVDPSEIEPGYMMRLAGIAPSPDAINASQPNGSTVCRIVNVDYDGTTNSADLDLDAVPYSMARAIRNAKPRPLPPRFLRRPEIPH